MDIPRTKKKLREANFFYGMMHERASMAFGEHEKFDFLLSAFLSAARSVTFVFEKEQSEPYKAFFRPWLQGLPSSQQRLLKFMNDDRVSEVHTTGSSRDRQDELIPVWTSYHDKSGSVTVSAPPATSEPPATVLKPAYFFNIDGIERNVLAVCKEHLDLLDVLVAEFCDSRHVT